jgi:hypothetical protein
MNFVNDLQQSATGNPVESNMRRNQKSATKANPYEGKSEEQTLTPVTCS